MYHKHSLFPLAVIFLTFVLAVLMVTLFRVPVQTETVSVVDTTSAEEITVNSDGYRVELAGALSVFSNDMEYAPDDLSKLVAAEKAQERLLALRVPVEYKELHLDLVILLNDIKAALRSADRSLETPLAQINLLRETYPWLKN
jgi:hypothetical protein